MRFDRNRIREGALSALKTPTRPPVPPKLVPVGGLPIEHRWEVSGGLFWTAKHVQEISPVRAESLADTMAPIEELTSVLGCTVPWTLSAITRRGLERKMARYERRRGFEAEVFER